MLTHWSDATPLHRGFVRPSTFARIAKRTILSLPPSMRSWARSLKINTDGFTLKLPRFGKFEVRHKQGKMRKIPLTGKTQMTADKRKVKFFPLSEILRLERKTVK